MNAVVRIVLVGFASAVAFGVGFAWRDVKAGRAPALGELRSVAQRDAKRPEPPTQVFSKSYRHILQTYYRPVDSTELRYSALQGMLGSLGDPHTQFLEPIVAKEFAKETQGTADFVGVGARLTVDPLGAKVMSVFEEGPAASAGLKGGDLITTVDGERMAGIAIDEIVSRIRGKEGTKVRLGILRAGRDKILSLDIVRRKVVRPTVEGEVLPESKIGYMRVEMFSQTTSEQFDQTMAKFDKEKVEGLIIDLRNNPGGLLDVAVDMLSRFLDDKVVVRLRYRRGPEQPLRTYSGLARRYPYPVVCLINEDTASAAEILSGALSEYGIATLVGEHTYGKASVQTVFPLVDGSNAKITIAKYYLPHGRDIGRTNDEYGQYKSGGIPADVEVKFDFKPGAALGQPQGDNQLRRAIEVIQAKKGQRVGWAPMERAFAYRGLGSFQPSFGMNA